MLEHRGAERSMITGNSVHNQRVERFWRDLHYAVTHLYYRLFYHMEYHDLLDPTNEKHLYSLHYIYLPRINAAQALFRDGWSNHRIRTEHNQSPQQLFTAGMLRLQCSGMVAVDFFEGVDNDYGVDKDGLPGEINDHSGVQVPEGAFTLTHEQLEQLQRTVDLQRESDNYGIDLYEEILLFINSIE